MNHSPPRRRRLPVLFFLTVAMLPAVLAACGKGLEQYLSAEDRARPGRSRYVFHCSACHGKAGLGARRLFPPLAGSPWVNGPAEVPIRILLHGLEGELELKGERYMNKMPAVGDPLSDAIVAEVLTYVRASFGNGAEAVRPEEVARLRTETSTRGRAYTPREIEAIFDSLTAGGDPREAGAGGLP